MASKTAIAIVADALLARLELPGQLDRAAPARTSCTSLRRSSGGYGGRLFGIRDSFLQSVKVSTKPGQLHYADWLRVESG